MSTHVALQMASPLGKGPRRHRRSLRNLRWPREQQNQPPQLLRYSQPQKQPNRFHPLQHQQIEQGTFLPYPLLHPGTLRIVVCCAEGDYPLLTVRRASERVGERMSRVRGLSVFLLCVSAATPVSMFAQDARDLTQVPQDKAVIAPNSNNGFSSGWLLGGRGQNRIINPFRTTPAPGAAPKGSLTTPRIATPSQQIPGNATADALVEDWSCNSGFQQQGSTCIAVEIPANAALTLSGHDWLCKRGFRRQGQGCAAVSIPQNASLNAAGSGWVCNFGFRPQDGTCVAVVVPDHASLDKTGRNWEIGRASCRER